MGLRFRDQVVGSCFFVTTSFYEHRRFGDVPGVYAALTDSLCYYINKYKGLLPAYVFMPTHIHLLLMIKGSDLGPFMRDFKKYVSQKSSRDCGIVAAPLWQPRYDRVVIETEMVFRQKLEYIHQNPVKAGLSREPKSWIWSSAPAYRSVSQVTIPVWTDWTF
jgi:putative transposase